MSTPDEITKILDDDANLRVAVANQAFVLGEDGGSVTENDFKEAVDHGYLPYVAYEEWDDTANTYLLRLKKVRKIAEMRVISKIMKKVIGIISLPDSFIVS